MAKTWAKTCPVCNVKKEGRQVRLCIHEKIMLGMMGVIGVVVVLILIF